MTWYNGVIIKLSDSQVDKLKSARKDETAIF